MKTSQGTPPSIVEQLHEQFKDASSDALLRFLAFLIKECPPDILIKRKIRIIMKYLENAFNREGV